MGGSVAVCDQVDVADRVADMAPFRQGDRPRVNRSGRNDLLTFCDVDVQSFRNDLPGQTVAGNKWVIDSAYRFSAMQSTKFRTWADTREAGLYENFPGAEFTELNFAEIN